MRGHETFPNAPIVEATVDFEAAFRVRPVASALGRYSGAVKDLYPQERDLHASRPSLAVAENEPVLKTTRQRFLELRSEDDKYILRVRRDGFSFTRLRPYVHWSDFSERAIAGWNLYSEIFHPSSLSAITLRYFNGIDLPNPLRVKEYFRTRITLPSGVPQSISNAFFSFTFTSRNDSSGTVSFFLDLGASNEQKIRVVFLIAVNQSLGISPSNVSRIKKTLSALRDAKNRVFFNSITEKMKEQFR